MAIIVTFERYRRLRGEPLIHVTRWPFEWTLHLPWWAVIVQWDDPTGGWQVVPKPTINRDADTQALFDAFNPPKA